MKYNEKIINSISEFINVVGETDVFGATKPIWYRGQADKDWKLLPKLLRSTDQLAKERYLISKFKQNASYVLDRSPASEFEWLFLMQHYGISTRLLDWSESPLPALYFAVENEEQWDKDGVLWCLLPCELNLKSHYSEEGFEEGIPSFDEKQLETYQPSSISAERSSKLFPMAAIATRNSHRMVAQQGVFTISHRYAECMSNIDGGSFLWRYVIPAASKKKILFELNMLGITKFQLFPELQNITNL